MDKLYAAPMEGLTGYLWRQVHAELFGPADKYFTPFLSPNATCTFQRKELDEIDPEHNRGLNVVPQLLTNRAEHFLWAVRELHDRGFREVNFNLGCPAGTVAAKRKGAGLLAYPQELDRCLEEIFAGLPRRMAGAAGDLSEVPSGGADRSSQAPEGILQGNAPPGGFFHSLRPLAGGV